MELLNQSIDILAKILLNCENDMLLKVYSDLCKLRVKLLQITEILETTSV